MSNEVEEQEGLQMSFLDHLDELRKRLIYTVASIAVAFAICFALSGPIFKFLEVPVVAQLQKQRKLTQASKGEIDPGQLKDGEMVQYTFTQETAVGGVKVPLGTTISVRKVTQDDRPALVLSEPWAVAKTILPSGTPLNKIMQDGESQLFFDDENNQLVINSVTGSFMIYVQVALYAGIALAIPIIFYQIWAFISPGLYTHEKKYITPVLVMATGFFILGASFAYKLAFPAAADYLLGLANEGGFRTLLNAEDYLGLIIMIMLGLGIVFQIPTIAFVLGRIGLVTPRMMLRVWRYAVVVIAIVAALLTPTPDAFNMMMFALPMFALYLLSIGIVWVFGKPRRSDKEVEALAHPK
ncbi:MAG: twin-arginine translocase subunit TatC [Blastocatellia bacterium]